MCIIFGTAQSFWGINKNTCEGRPCLQCAVIGRLARQSDNASQSRSQSVHISNWWKWTNYTVHTTFCHIPMTTRVASLRIYWLTGQKSVYCVMVVSEIKLNSALVKVKALLLIRSRRRMLARREKANLGRCQEPRMTSSAGAEGDIMPKETCKRFMRRKI